MSGPVILDPRPPLGYDDLAAGVASLAEADRGYPLALFWDVLIRQHGTGQVSADAVHAVIEDMRVLLQSIDAIGVAYATRGL